MRPITTQMREKKLRSEGFFTFLCSPWEFLLHQLTYLHKTSENFVASMKDRKFFYIWLDRATRLFLGIVYTTKHDCLQMPLPESRLQSPLEKESRRPQHQTATITPSSDHTLDSPFWKASVSKSTTWLSWSLSMTAIPTSGMKMLAGKRFCTALLSKPCSLSYIYNRHWTES